MVKKRIVSRIVGIVISLIGFSLVHWCPQDLPHMGQMFLGVFMFGMGIGILIEAE